ncbi:MAG: sulfatase-like hydrolase/transferase [Halobacteriales archaeon]
MPGDPTNVVFVLSDDQGPWAAGCYGNPEIRTPTIDRLAAEGLRFENFFCPSPVCSPSRASYLTGTLPSQHGVHDWIRSGNVPPGERDREATAEAPPAVPYLAEHTTYTEVLAAHGYECALSGKWHLGDSATPQAGFSRWFVHQSGGGPYYGAPVVRDGEFVREPRYITDAITEEALGFLDAVAEPFYLGVHYTAPHAPWTADGEAAGQHPGDLTESYDECAFESCPQEPTHPWAIGLTEETMGDREALKGYFAAVTAMDRGIGRIVDRLEELGLREDTLIVVTSDNGFSCGHHGFWGKGNGTFPLNMYENSVTVPFVASHPGRIPEGAVTGAMMSGYDLMPTLLEYLGLPVPDGDRPGRSYRPVWLGETDEARERVVVHGEYGNTRMLRTEDWKYVHRYPHGPHELYDLRADPDERENLVEDPAHRERVDDLRADLADWFGRHVDPRLDGARFPVTGRGQHARIDADRPGETVFEPREE